MNRLGVLDPNQLPVFAVLEKLDAEAIIAERMQKIVEVWASRDPPAAAQYDVGNTEFDPIRIVQEVSTYFELLLRDRVNRAAKRVTLAYGADGDLDGIASRYPGGVPRLAGESDERYRRRIWLSPSTLSPHGLEESYVFWALSADPDLHDASATTVEGTGHVTVSVIGPPDVPRLSSEIALESDTDQQWRDRDTAYYTRVAGLRWRVSATSTTWRAEYVGDPIRPSDAQLNAVRAFIADAGRKGATDIVSVLPGRVIEAVYRIDVWLYPGPDAPTTMRALLASLTTLVERQRWLGEDATRMAIATACGVVTGVQNARVIEPQDIAADARSVVQVNAIELHYRGRAE